MRVPCFPRLERRETWGTRPNLGCALALAMAVLAYCASARAAAKYKVLYDLPYPDDGVGAVTLDQKGNVYGATGNGGGGTGCQDEYGCGLIFELTPTPAGKWTFATVHDFTGGSDGAFPRAPLALDDSGNLYGDNTSGGAHGLGIAFQLTPGQDGWALSILYSFTSGRNGGAPWAGPARDASGNLYGTSDNAFELSPGSDGWQEAVLHRFGIRKGDGAGPYAGLILDASGNLYGTTSYGGTGTGCGGDGCGTVYELSLDAGGKWKETILHPFDNNGKDGVTPGSGALFMDPSGSLYGTTEIGGKGAWGTVFRLTRGADGRWQETILHRFANGPSGGFPTSGVVMDNAGNLYGTTKDGGNASGCGVLYKLAPTPKGKWRYSVLHTFGRVGDGCLPSGNLAIDSSDNLYGGTIFGGTHGNGIVFELTP